ncbi:hypothetical protein ACHAXR_012577 [Thalassiosira sp. AJA248-18]
MMGLINIVFLLVVVWQGLFAVAVDVTCGSAIRLLHWNTKKYFLKSQANRKLQTSGQQIVTLDTAGGDPSAMLWQIREAHNTTTCKSGQAIKCGDDIRLTHIGTGKNLHSHGGFRAPLSPSNSEVSAFEGGDTGDNWRVLCLTGDGQELWQSDSLVRFMHVDTNRWLSSSSKMKFNQSNCPHCPLHGELEVSGTNRNSDAAIQFFRADDGAYLRV